MSPIRTSSLFLSILILLIFSSKAEAQSNISPLDSVIVESIEFSKIPSSMAQTRIKVDNILSDMVTLEYLNERKHLNDSVAASIKVSIQKMLARSMDDVNSRYIVNSQIEVKVQKDKINKEVNRMSSLVNSLDKSDGYLKRQKAIWIATENKLIKEKYSDTMLDRVSSVMLRLDSAHQELNTRTEVIFFILDLCSKTDVELDKASESLVKLQVSLEDMLANSKNPNILKLDYRPENTVFLPQIKEFLIGSYEDTKAYVSSKSESLIFVLIAFIIITYLFFTNKTKIVSLQENNADYYREKLGQILRSPLNAALMLILALASILLKDRPFAIKQLMLYFSLVPLFVLASNVIRKPFKKYIIAFFLLIFPITALSVFPPDNVFYRLILMFLAICDNLIIGHYFYHHFRHSKAKDKFDKFGRVIVYVLIIFGLVSFVSAFFGKIMLAQILLMTTFYAVYGAAVLYISSVMINGLLITVLEGERARKINAIAIYYKVIVKKIVLLVNIVAIYLWLMNFFTQLKVADQVTDFFIGIFQHEWEVGAMHINVGNIIIFFIVIYISSLLARALQVILEGDVLNKMNMAQGLPHSIAVMVRYTFIVLGVVLATSAVGLKFTNFTVIFGALGVGIGFGLQSIFNNLVSGFILLFERPVKIGDTVEIGTLIGKVKTIGLRSSNIHTIEGAEVIVPNGQLVSNEVINWTLSDQRRRIDVMVGVSYDSDPQQVKSLLEEILSDHPLILQDPKPSVFFLEMGESSLDFRMLFWTASYSEWYKIRSEIVMRTFETLKSNGIEIPFPQRDIHIKGGNQLPL